MANDNITPTLQQIASQLVEAKAAIPAAKELLGILRDSGEDTSEVQALITEAELRIAQWERTLQRRGITLPSVELEEEEE